jgi:hypothetical protein
MCIPDIGNCKNPEPKLARVFSEFEVGCWTIRVGLAFNRRAHGGQEEEVLTKCTEFLNEFGRSLISVEASCDLCDLCGEDRSSARSSITARKRPCFVLALNFQLSRIFDNIAARSLNSQPTILHISN